jgi:tetratricopeptide (TPR) repeat protein
MKSETTKEGHCSKAGGEELSRLLKAAAVFKACKRVKQAEDVYTTCIERFPDDFRAYFNLGTIYQGRKCPEKAKILLSKALQLNEEIIDTYVSLSGVLISCHEAAEAVSIAQRGLRLDPESSLCLYNLNVALRMTSHIVDAIEFTWKTFDANPHALRLFDVTYAPTQENRSNVVFVCVKWGTKYGAEYVNNLYRAIRRQCSIQDLRLLCLTDDNLGVIEEVHCVDFPTAASEWKGWWLKAAIFSDELGKTDTGREDIALVCAGDTMVYIDLDTVLYDSIDFLVDSLDLRHSLHKHASPLHEQSRIESQPDVVRLATLHTADMANEARSCGLNSSIMVWQHGQMAVIYAFLVANYVDITKCIYKFDHYMEMMLYRYFNTRFSPCVSPPSSHARGDIVITTINGVSTGSGEAASCYHPHSRSSVVFLQDIFPGTIHEYASLRRQAHSRGYGQKLDCNECSESVVSLPENGSIVCFPLQPKPLDVVDLHAWIKEHWQGQRKCD